MSLRERWSVYVSVIANRSTKRPEAQAMGAKHGGHRVGSLGNAGCLSFFPSKNLGAYGDGGMVVTNDEKIAETVRMLRMHGCKVKYQHFINGFNSRLDTLQAAVLRVKLRHLEKWNSLRREKLLYYNELFTKQAGALQSLTLPAESPNTRHSAYAYTLQAKQRDELQKFLQTKGVSTAIYYPRPLHLQPVYAHLNQAPGAFPISEQACQAVLSLPIYPEITTEQQTYIVDAVCAYYA